MISANTMQLVVEAFSGKISPFSHNCIGLMLVFLILGMIVTFIGAITCFSNTEDNFAKQFFLIKAAALFFGIAMAFELIAFITR